MDLTKLNAVAKSKSYLPTVKLMDLKPKKYCVVDIRKVTTKFGVSTVLDLDNECAVFMPSRINRLVLTEEAKIFDNLKEAATKERLFIQYKGDGELEFIHEK